MTLGLNILQRAHVPTLTLTWHTSSGEIFSPPRLISSLMRPVSVRKPSPSRKPWSPVWNHPPAKACAGHALFAISSEDVPH